MLEPAAGSLSKVMFDLLLVAGGVRPGTYSTSAAIAR
jgi:hypothetical protein